MLKSRKWVILEPIRSIAMKYCAMLRLNLEHNSLHFRVLTSKLLYKCNATYIAILSGTANKRARAAALTNQHCGAASTNTEARPSGPQPQPTGWRGPVGCKHIGAAQWAAA